MSPRFAMAVDTRRCVGCNGCVIACKTENAVPEGGFRDWIAEECTGTFPDLALRKLAPSAATTARTRPAWPPAPPAPATWGRGAPSW